MNDNSLRRVPSWDVSCYSTDIIRQSVVALEMALRAGGRHRFSRGNSKDEQIMMRRGSSTRLLELAALSYQGGCALPRALGVHCAISESC